MSDYQEWLEGIDYNLKKVLQRDPLTNDEVIMELYREISMQYVSPHSHCLEPIARPIAGTRVPCRRYPATHGELG